MLYWLRCQYLLKKLFINLYYFLRKEKRRNKREKLDKKYLSALVKAIEKKYKDYWIFCPRWSLGDAAICASLMHDFKKQNKGKVVFILSKNSLYQLFRYAKDIDVLIFDRVFDTLQLNKIYNGFQKGKISYLFAATGNVKKADNLLFLYQNMLNLKNQPTCINLTQKKFKKMPKKDFVLIIPDSVTFDSSCFDEIFWSDKIKEFLEKGYDVYFNTNNPLFGKFNRIFYPLIDTCLLAKKAKKVIAVRSGIVDLFVSLGIENMEVLYPPEMKISYLTIEKEVEIHKNVFNWKQQLSIDENLFNIYSINKMFASNIEENILPNKKLKKNLDSDSLVSILVPYYNDEKYLAECIKSVLAQSYTKFELILLNHGSIDSSEKIANSFKDNRIKHIKLSYNYGAGTGILVLKFLQEAKGKYIKLFCADDVMPHDALYHLVSYMDKNPEIDFAFGDMLDYVGNSDSFQINTSSSWFENILIPRKKVERQNEVYVANLNNIYRDYMNCVTDFPLPYPANIIRRNALENIEINKSFIMMFDMSLWFSLLLNNKKIGFCKKVVTYYRRHNEQMSSMLHINKNLIVISYEKKNFIELSFLIKDISLLKKIFPNENNVRRLNSDDIKYIPFVLAEIYSRFDDRNISSKACDVLFHILNSDLYFDIEKKFHYTIKDYRDMMYTKLKGQKA